MTEEPFMRIRRDNLKTMRRELYRLKTEKDILFNLWLEKAGEYVTATYVRWTDFRIKAIEYKELWAKVQQVAKGVEE